MRSSFARPIGALLSGVLAIGLGFGAMSPAAATTTDATAASQSQWTAPITERVDLTADSLPTVQIDNGVVWAQVVHGDIVYVGGEFENARPAGSQPGTNLVPRKNLLAYNIRTGQLISSWAPSVNAKVKSLAISADGTKLLVGGSFTVANGTERLRMAAFSLTTGALDGAFKPTFSSTVNTIAVSDQAVYAGGLFWRVGNRTRNRLAAVNPTTGVPLDSFAPSVTGDDGYVQAIALTPDKTKLYVAGSFSYVNGADAPGLAEVNPANGAFTRLPASNVIANTGTEASFMSLRIDSDGYAYTTGYAWGQADKRLEGAAAINTADGSLKWLADCHGDTYDAVRLRDVVYTVSHHHHCENIGGFPDTEPRVFWQYAQGFSVDATGLVRRNNQGSYANFEGNPAPSMVTWFPRLEAGGYTGRGQAAWTTQATDEYLLLGGEFPYVNGARQQGLARFAVPSLSTNRTRPQVTSPEWAATGIGIASNLTRVSVPANWDRDDWELTYELYRQGVAEPVATTTAKSTWWTRPQVTLIDRTELTAGETYQYRVRAKDRDNNAVNTEWISIVAGAEIHPYLGAVLQDGASHLWRPTGSGTWDDIAGGTPAQTYGNNVSSVAGVLPHDPAARITQSWWSSNSYASNGVPETGLQEFSVEAWFNTTSGGGKIVGFGNSRTGNSGSNDRHVYMKSNGQLVFGVYPDFAATISSPRSYNDGQWHHVVATLSGDGMTMTVDGKRVAQSNVATSAQQYSGYWRIGGDSLSGWPDASGNYFSGSVDEVAIYPTALTLAQSRAHYVASGRTLDIPPTPTDSYGAAVHGDNPQVYWRLNETTGDAIDVMGNANGVVSGVMTRGAASPVAPGSAYQMSGNSSNIRTPDAQLSPNVYSTELWFNTTTTRGGKLISFGNQPTGGSGNYDRHVYLDEAGHVYFGLWAGQIYTIQSSTPFNDGEWHHVVATQGTDGMKLYIDGQLIGTNARSTGDNYTGYWRVGGDRVWVSGDEYIAATIDEVAIYDHVLTPERVVAHYAASPAAPNLPPVGDFTSTCTGMACEFTGSASDPDGSVASTVWAFGDGGTSSELSPSHTFAATGTYTVTLTVTDDKGATTVVTKQVSVFANPVAEFTASCDDLACAFDGSASTPAGSTLAWTFGDGASGTGASVSHTYAAAGTYDVTLTVTNGAGVVNTKTTQVTVLAPNVAPVASFTQTTTGLRVEVDGSGSTDSDGTIASYAWTFGDGGTATGATASHTYAAAGTYTVQLVVTDNRGGTHSASHQVTVEPIPNVAPVASFTKSATGLTVSVNGSGSTDSDGTIASYAWTFGDGGTATGATANHTYAAAGTYDVTLTVTDDQGATHTATQSVTVAPIPNVAPVAAFTPAVTEMLLSVDGSASTDPDGSIVSWDWSFGDGTTGTGKLSGHTYETAGTFDVTLTVTDNDGATHSVTHQVTVTQALIADSFGRTTTNGWGNADAGGSWSHAYASYFSTDGSAGLVTLPRGGVTAVATLNGTTARDINVSVKLAASNAPVTGPLFNRVRTRVNGNTYYETLVYMSPTNQTVNLNFTRVVNGASTNLGDYRVPGLTYSANEVLNLQFEVVGDSSTTLRAKLWKQGSAEPANWQFTRTDATPALQVAGGFAFTSYANNNNAAVPVTIRWDDLVVKPA